MALNIGDVVDGKYRIIRLLGEGGMGAVYEGENTRIHRRVAIKVLHAGVAHTQDAVQRFEREAQAAGRIGNQHIVEVLDLGNLPEGDRYMVMEFLDGESLADRIRGCGRLGASEVCTIAVGMLEGLQAAHDVGIIHRDLKPDNVFLIKRSGQSDFVKLVDFGISKFSAVGGEFSMTRTGAVMGTPYYMSPEQAKGTRDIDHRVDLYAAGVILYEAVTGQVPFDAETFNELLFKIVLEEPPPVSKAAPELDTGFAAIVDKARSKDPAARYQTARDFQQALTQWAGGARPEIAALGATQIGAGPGSTLGGPSTMGRATTSAWANSGEQAVAAAGNKHWIMITAAIVLLLGLGWVFKLSSNSGAEGEESALAAANEQAGMAAERERAEQAQQVAEQGRASAERATDEARQKLKEIEQAAENAEAKAAAAASAQGVKPPGGKASPVAPKTTAKAATTGKAADPKPAASAQPSTTGGTQRKIRTSL